MSTAIPQPAKVLFGAFVAALGIYSVLTRMEGSPSPLIDGPEVVASRVDGATNEKGEPEYDVVIIGGGTAGCVLAARLSEDPRVRVLLLEAGGSSCNVLHSKIPSAFGRLMGTDKDYGLSTEPQVYADNLRKVWPRGKMLGGCSASNAMIFHTGAPSDYDEWARTGLEGAEQWSFENFLPYFHKFENFIPSSQFPEVDSSTRGKNGPVTVGYFGYFHDVCSKWMRSCTALGIPFNPDINNAKSGTLGVTKLSETNVKCNIYVKLMTYIDPSGTRVTTERSYLTPEVLKRPNLKVAIHATVTQILFSTKGELKRAVGVEFAREKVGPRYRVRAKQHIVLTAGAIHSPHILMLSGVGPKEHLSERGIHLVHDLPGVGQNLQDHLVINTRFRLKPGYSMQYLRSNKLAGVPRRLASLLRWKVLGTGPLTSNLAEAAAFMRSDDVRLVLPDSYQIKDETSGPDAPDLESFVVPLAYPIAKRLIPNPPGDLMTMGTVLSRPQSVGSITLKSNDPFDPPVIDPRYLTTQNDVAVLVRGLKLALRLVKTEPLSSVVLHDDDPLLDHNLDLLSDAELEAEVRKRPESLYHPTVTCRMARLDDGGVVDSYLRVHGIENLRIADASIFPRIPSGHTAAPVIAVGEKASDLIKESLKF